MEASGLDKYLRLHRPTLLRRVMRAGVKRDEAEDIVQMACVRAYRRIDAVDPNGLGGYISTVLRTSLIDSHRANHEHFEINEETLSISFCHRPEQALAVRDALRRLKPRRSAQMFMLQHAYGMTIPEIAVIFGVSVGSAKSSLNRASDFLRANAEIAP